MLTGSLVQLSPTALHTYKSIFVNYFFGAVLVAVGVNVSREHTVGDIIIRININCDNYPRLCHWALPHGFGESIIKINLFQF